MLCLRFLHDYKDVYRYKITKLFIPRYDSKNRIISKSEKSIIMSQ